MTAAKIGIVDYGLGNLTSVAGAVEKLGHDWQITSDPATLAACDKIILPGVGAFGDGIKNLHERDLVKPLTELALEKGKPILGICLGFQLIATGSEEFGDHEGLNWIEGRVRILVPDDPDLKVPHVGWNDLTQFGPSPIFEGIPDDALFYYVHSYYFDVADSAHVIGKCDYGREFVAAVNRDNIWGTQFHPEKSQQHGLTVLSNFLVNA
jgi:imidazole glycerol-phosphate synthase subunit HisH